MGLHAYSGSLVRFYTNDWENEIQRTARENGWSYNVHYPEGEPKWPTADEAREHLAWMRERLSENAGQPVEWNDEEVTYRTTKLHDEAREALMIVAAHLHRPELSMPQQMSVKPYDDVAYSEAGPKGYLFEHMAPFEAALIFPGTFSTLRLMEDPLGGKVLTCSTGLLRGALAFVRDAFWRGAVEPDSWLSRGLVYARGASSSTQIDGEWIKEREPEPSDSLRCNAEFGFAVMSSMLDFADRHNTAIASTA